MNDVAFIQQKFGKVGAVLAGDAGDEGGFWGHFKVQVKRCKIQGSRSVSAISLFKAHDVVFTQVTAGLQLDNFKRNAAWIV